MNKVRVGIWGLGRAGAAMHTAEIGAHAEKFEIVAGCDTTPERAEAFARTYKAPGYTDPAQFLADQNIELVAVATRSLDHVRHAQAALEAGFAVLLEKPLAQSRAEAEALVEMDRKYPGKLFCRQNRRFEPAFQHVREIIDSGILGKVHTIKLRRNNFSRRDDWQALLSEGGGQLNNWGPHLIDHALQFLHYRVDAVWGELKLVAAQGDAEDSVKILIKGKDGCTVDIEIFGGAALPANVYEVYGSRGALVSADEQDLKLRYIEPDYELKPYPAKKDNPPGSGWIFADNAQLPWRRLTIMTEPKLKVNMNSLYGCLYDTLRDGKPFPIKLEEALAVIEICDIVKSQSPIYINLQS